MSDNDEPEDEEREEIEPDEPDEPGPGPWAKTSSGDTEHVVQRDDV